MNPENHYIDEQEEALLNDPDFIDALASEYEDDDDENLDDEEAILKEYGY